MKNRFCILRVFACVFALLVFGGAAHAQEQVDIRAHERAQQWLKLLDAGKYAASWEETATLFRDNILRAEWVTMLKKNRSELGKVTERKLRKLTRSHTLPEAPEGNYVVIVFETTFAEREQPAAEFVILAMTDRLGNLLPAIETPGAAASEREIISPVEGADWSPFSYYVSFEPADAAAEVSPESPSAEQVEPTE